MKDIIKSSSSKKDHLDTFATWLPQPANKTLLAKNISKKKREIRARTKKKRTNRHRALPSSDGGSRMKCVIMNWIHNMIYFFIHHRLIASTFGRSRVAHRSRARKRERERDKKQRHTHLGIKKKREKKKKKKRKTEEAQSEVKSSLARARAREIMVTSWDLSLIIASDLRLFQKR